MRQGSLAELHRLEDTETQDETVARLHRQNQRLIAEIKALQAQVTDLRNNLTNCSSEIMTLQSLLRSAESIW